VKKARKTRKGADNEDEDDDALSRISPAPTATGDESVKNERERAEWIYSRTRSTAKRQIYVFDTLRYIHTWREEYMLRDKVEIRSK